MARNKQRKEYRAVRLMWVPETGQYIQPGDVVPLVELGRSQAVIQMHLADGNVTVHDVAEEAPPADADAAVDEE